MMSRKKASNELYDHSIPGYTELSAWPIQPSYPAKILEILVYRNSSVGVTIKGKNGKPIDFFFNRFIGHLCYGEDERENNAAYIQKGSHHGRH